MVERIIDGQQVVFANYGEELLRMSEDGVLVTFFDHFKKVVPGGTIYNHHAHVMNKLDVGELIVYLNRWITEGRLFDAATVSQ